MTFKVKELPAHCPSPKRPLAGLVLLISLSFGLPIQAEGRWYYSGFAGAMTTNRWHEIFDPFKLDFAKSGFVGSAIGWDRQIRQSRFRYGFEAQVAGHFGLQDHLEFNLPIVLRYTPGKPFPRSLKSTAFGFGLSHATKVPQVEIDRKGASQRTFVYWMAETEFTMPQPDTSLYLRLHHRSDGYGVFDVSSGATGVVLGFRRDF